MEGFRPPDDLEYTVVWLCVEVWSNMLLARSPAAARSRPLRRQE